jgi:hypothetical protein
MYNDMNNRKAMKSAKGTGNRNTELLKYRGMFTGTWAASVFPLNKAYSV